MRNETRKLFNQFLERQTELNSIDNASTKFSVEASVQQTLETRMQESSDFLGKINIIGVDEQQGEKLGLGINGTIASTTDTTGDGKRTPVDPTDLDNKGYHCTQTNFDTGIRYAKLDAWAKFKDFQVRIRNAILQRQALDRIMIGFNGTGRAATSNQTDNPLLEDVNIGWLEKIRQYAKARHLAEVADGSGKIIVGGGATAAEGYKNLDALVYDMVNNMLEPWYQDDTELVVVCGRKMLSDKYFPLVNTSHAPTETLAADLIISQKRIGGLSAVRVPYFPASGLLITRLDNLSMYYQNGSRRRHIKDDPEKDRIVNFESSNDAFVVEDYGCAAFAENIELVA